MRLKELEKENAELKKMYAETILDKRINPFRTTILLPFKKRVQL